MAQRGVNKVILIGNLGNDPELRYMQNGNAVASMTIATSETWKDQQDQKKEKTEWHRVILFKRLAEIAGEYLKKGAKVYLEGKLQTREWTDQQGVKRYTTEVVVNELQMLDSRQSGSAGPAQSTSNHQQPAQGNQPPTGNHGTYNEPPMDFDDDIPF